LLWLDLLDTQERYKTNFEGWGEENEPQFVSECLLLLIVRRTHFDVMRIAMFFNRNVWREKRDILFL